MTLNSSRLAPRASCLVRDTAQATRTLGGAPGDTVESAVSADAAVHGLDVAQEGVLHLPTPRRRLVGVIPAPGTPSQSDPLPKRPPVDLGARFVVPARFTHASSDQTRCSPVHALIAVDATS